MLSSVRSLLVLYGDLVIILSLFWIGHSLISVKLSTFDSDFRLGYLHLCLKMLSTVSKTNANIWLLLRFLVIGWWAFCGRVAEFGVVAWFGSRFEVLYILGELIRPQLNILLRPDIFLSCRQDFWGSLTLESLREENAAFRDICCGQMTLFGRLWSDFDKWGGVSARTLVQFNAKIILDDLQLIGR